jgi:ribosome biogenesis GTPase
VAAPDRRLTRQSAGGDSGWARVVASYGRRYAVVLPDGLEIECVSRGKRLGVACGDLVLVRPAGGHGVIEEIGPRRSLLQRAETNRAKNIAANVSQVGVVVAVEPRFSEDIVVRALVAAAAGGIDAFVILNKIDLVAGRAAAEQRIAPFAAAGYTVMPLCAKADVAALRRRLNGHRTVLIGESGMGKSSLINALTQQATAAVGEVSRALNAGRHTTSHARLYAIAPDAELIDAPGVREFGLAHLDVDALAQAFPDFRSWLDGCKYNDCSHRGEPSCSLRAAVEVGVVDARRYAQFLRLSAHANPRRSPGLASR